MYKVVVLTDFSAAADSALRYATQLAHLFRARLILVHVRRAALLAGGVLPGEYSEAAAWALLAERCASAQAEGVVCSCQLETGEVASEFAAAAEVHDAILVVVSLSSTEKGVTEGRQPAVLDLLRCAPCPLLLLPESYQLPALPRELIIATDGQPAHLTHPPALANLLRAAAPLVVRAVRVAAEAEGYAARPASSELAVTFGAATAEAVRVVAGPDPVAALVGIGQAQPASWLVLWTRQHSRLNRWFHHSVTAAVAARSVVPVLVLAEAGGASTPT